MLTKQMIIEDALRFLAFGALLSVVVWLHQCAA
jgi:hypothetical protein